MIRYLGRFTNNAMAGLISVLKSDVLLVFTRKRLSVYSSKTPIDGISTVAPPGGANRPNNSSGYDDRVVGRGNGGSRWSCGCSVPGGVCSWAHAGDAIDHRAIPATDTTRATVQRAIMG